MKWLALLGLFLGQDPDVDGLLKQLTDESIEVREKAAAALIELGDKAEEKVKARMASAEGELQKRCQWILERIAIPRRLRGVLPPLRKVTIEAKEKNLKEVLEDLQRQSGMAMNLEGVGEQPVTVSAKEVGPMQALDAVCKAAGLGYFIDSYQPFIGRAMGPAGVARPPGGAMDSAEPRVRFQPGAYVDVPRQFVRHYLVEPTNITLMKSDNFRQSTSNAQLNLRVLWPPEVNPRVGTLGVILATDDKGRVLYEAAKAANKYGWGGGTSRTSLGNTVQLSYPESDARKIASIKGVVLLKYVMEEKVITFEAPEGAAATTKEYEGMTVELQECKSAGGIATVKITLTGRPKSADLAEIAASGGLHNYPIRIKTEDGNLGQTGGSSRRGGAGSTTCELTFHQVQSKITAIEVVVDTLYHEDKFDFELKDIPLPK